MDRECWGTCFGPPYTIIAIRGSTQLTEWIGMSGTGPDGLDSGVFCMYEVQRQDGEAIKTDGWGGNL